MDIYFSRWLFDRSFLKSWFRYWCNSIGWAFRLTQAAIYATIRIYR